MSRRKSGLQKFIFLLFFLGLLGAAWFLWRDVFIKERVVSPLPKNEKLGVNIFSIFSNKKDPEDLKKKVKQKTGFAWKNYSVLVVDIKSDFRMAINDTEMFIAASVNKIPILASLYIEIQNGQVNPEEVITVQPEDIQDYGTGSIRYNGAGSTYTIKTLARLMMQESDNTAAYILANHIVGIDKIQKNMNDWGMT